MLFAVGVEDKDGLVQALEAEVLVTDGGDIILGDPLAPDLPEEEVQVDVDGLDLGLGELLQDEGGEVNVAFSDIPGKGFRAASEGHDTILREEMNRSEQEYYTMTFTIFQGVCGGSSKGIEGSGRL